MAVFTVGEKGEVLFFERKGKKDPSIRSKTETHFATHAELCKYCHKTFLITAWKMMSFLTHVTFQLYVL